MGVYVFLHVLNCCMVTVALFPEVDDGGVFSQFYNSCEFSFLKLSTYPLGKV